MYFLLVVWLVFLKMSSGVQSVKLGLDFYHRFCDVELQFYSVLPLHSQ